MFCFRIGSDWFGSWAGSGEHKVPGKEIVLFPELFVGLTHIWTQTNKKATPNLTTFSCQFRKCVKHALGDIPTSRKPASLLGSFDLHRAHLSRPPAATPRLCSSLQDAAASYWPTLAFGANLQLLKKKRLARVVLGRRVWFWGRLGGCCFFGWAMVRCWELLGVCIILKGVFKVFASFFLL